MTRIAFTVGVSLLASAISAQTILNYSQLPQCAQTCQRLQQAQTACEAPAPQPLSCFCQSAYLPQLYNSPDGTCDAECTSEADRQQIRQWYINTCRNGASSNTAASSAASAAASTGAATATTGSNAAATSSASDSSSDASNDGSTSSSGTSNGDNGSWWHTHSRWIAMVIVLIIGFAFIIAGGIWWKKRSDRKRDRATASTLPSVWGPANPHPATSEKTQSAMSVSSGQGIAPAVQPQMSTRSKGSKKLAKMVGR